MPIGADTECRSHSDLWRFGVHSFDVSPENNLSEFPGHLKGPLQRWPLPCDPHPCCDLKSSLPSCDARDCLVQSPPCLSFSLSFKQVPLEEGLNKAIHYFRKELEYQANNQYIPKPKPARIKKGRTRHNWAPHSGDGDSLFHTDEMYFSFFWKRLKQVSWRTNWNFIWSLL